MGERVRPDTASGVVRLLHARTQSLTASCVFIAYDLLHTFVVVPDFRFWQWHRLHACYVPGCAEQTLVLLLFAMHATLIKNISVAPRVLIDVTTFDD